MILLLVCFSPSSSAASSLPIATPHTSITLLYLRIQQEWAAGRWPLWDPGQNAGMPLLGMPMSAVFYPGKFLYAILVYPWATRLYTIAHVIIAWAGMFALARGWRQSPTAAGLAAMAYAFGAPVLFQYCNIIYLVGAAWVPWGFLSLEWLLHQKQRWGLLGLAGALALQVLGGDPEAAYLTVLCGSGYALVLAAGDAKTNENVLMRRIVVPLLGPACALTLLLVCFRAVLFGGEQFAYRDAAHFYYPLYFRVQQEWAAGRWPLWDPWQNAGMPLLGIPMSAVFYPGKILYAIVAYPWATRLYTIAHVAIAWAGMFALARAWRQSLTAAGLAAMAYAFGAPVLFQHCNIIFLVGAAWVPWSFLALEWLLHQQWRWGLLGLALVLTLQVLGGDPEAAYLTVLCGGGYALVLAAGDAREPRRRGCWFWCGAAGLIWVAVTFGAAYASPRIVIPRWLPPGGVVRALAWGLLVLWVIVRWRQRGRGPRLAPMVAALMGSCLLAVLLAAAQLLPTLEYAGNTARAVDERPGRIFGFCVEPYRVLEMVWPGAYGRFGPANRSWLHAIPPRGERGSGRLRFIWGA